MRKTVIRQKKKGQAEPIGAGRRALNHHGVVTTLYHRLPSRQTQRHGLVVLRCTRARTCHVSCTCCSSLALPISQWGRDGNTAAHRRRRGSQGEVRGWSIFWEDTVGGAVAGVGCKRCSTSCDECSALLLFPIRVLIYKMPFSITSTANWNAILHS